MTIDREEAVTLTREYCAAVLHQSAIEQGHLAQRHLFSRPIAECECISAKLWRRKVNETTDLSERICTALSTGEDPGVASGSFIPDVRCEHKASSFEGAGTVEAPAVCQTCFVSCDHSWRYITDGSEGHFETCYTCGYEGNSDEDIWRQEAN